MDLSPLETVLDDMEKAVAGVAEKVSTAVSSDVSQAKVDALVQRGAGLVERLVGLQAPATAVPPATPGPSVQATPGGSVWTPDKPSA
jgi:hypothetical protein